MEREVIPAKVVVDAERYVLRMLSEQLTRDHWYHDLEHTLQVRRVAMEIGERLELAEEELEILELAALFHDTGFTEVYEGHESVSMRIARVFLSEWSSPEERRDKVLRCIDSTRLHRQPETLLEQIICDADLSNLAQSDYLRRAEDLRHEWETFRKERYGKTDWHALNREFMKGHYYHTEIARELFDEGKEANLEMLKDLVERKKKKKQKSEKKNIQGNRNAQMMFKTALRNHLDLSSLADNKANIMLSVNTLIITFVLPLGLSYVYQRPYLLVPIGCLLITSLVSMIFATLATRPMKMVGQPTEEKLQRGTANLFFFGNFFRMDFDDYRRGMETILSDEDILESAIMRDLHSLGRSLGLKYRRLRICYTVFMVGIVVTVLVFSLGYWTFYQ